MAFYLLDHGRTNGTQWQQWAYPRRGAKLSGTVIMHTSESTLDVIGDDSTAEDCAYFIAGRTGSYGSYHDIVDSDSIIEMLPFEYEAWQDSETNNWAVGISAACRTTDWATMGEAKREGFYRNLALCAADFVTYMREAYGIKVPLIRISGEQARNRVPGFCAHGDSGISRSDPGRDFDWERFFKYTKEVLEGVEEVPITEGFTEKAMQDLAVMVRNAVWGYTNKELDSRDMRQIVADIAAGNIQMTNQYGTRISLVDQISWIDKNINDSRDVLMAAIAGVQVNVDLTDDQLTALSDSLKTSLGANVAAELARRLSE